MTDSPQVLRPWAEPMPAEQFARMCRLIAAPTPIGFEGAMVRAFLDEMYQFAPPWWQTHRFVGTAGVVVDTMPHAGDDILTVMMIGHADKIRLHVRSIGPDGKIWVNSDSMLPITPIGQRVILFSEDPKRPGVYRRIEGGTIEAYGAVHTADEKFRDGSAGPKKKELYLDLQIWGEKGKEQVEALGVRPGDPIIFDSPVRAGFAPQTFVGAYLDNALGVFAVLEVARLIAHAQRPVDDIRVMFAVASHEEVGLFGSRVLVGELQPDVVIGVDVNFDLVGTPHKGSENYQPLAMGKGFTLQHGGITSPTLNSLFQEVAIKMSIPIQIDVNGRTPGTDAWAGFLAARDAASTSIGFPTRNMHSATEVGHTGDLLAAIHALAELVKFMSLYRIDEEYFETHHPDLTQAETLTWQSAPEKDKED